MGTVIPRDGYFTYPRWYTIFIAAEGIQVVAACVGFVGLGLFVIAGNTLPLSGNTLPLFGINVDPTNPLLRDPNRFVVGAIFIIICGPFVGFAALFFVTEFWRRLRPTRIDEQGLTNYAFGRVIRRLGWSDVDLIVKVRFRQYCDNEIIWLRGGTDRVKSLPSYGSARVQLERGGNPWRRYLALFPKGDFWITTSMAMPNFRAACNLVTYYARLHGIPMILVDSTPHAFAKLKETTAPEADRETRRRGLVQWVDHV